MQDLNTLFYYAKVVEHGGFAAAGRALGMPKSTLSRRVALLEEQLGIRLLQRSSRRFAPTDVGQIFYRHCVAMIVEAQAAQEAVDETRAEPRGTIRVTCPISLTQSHVSAMIARFLSANPQVRIHLSATNRQVDVIEEGVDVALRVRFPPLENTELVMRKLADSVQLLVAHPALLDRIGRPEMPEELRRFDTLDLIRGIPRHRWDMMGPDGAEAQIDFDPRYVSDDLAALREAALAGLGIVQLPEFMVRDQIAAGNLEAVLPRWSLRAGIIHAVIPSRRGLAHAVRSFIDFLVEEFAAEAVTNAP
jgi:DNA-binding transcriptional LysR family regulator